MLHVKDPDRNQVRRVASQIILCLPIPSPSLPNFFFCVFKQILSLVRHLSLSLFLKYLFVYLTALDWDM